MRGWIEDMKASKRGPFFRIRWFCNDGTQLPPKPDACKEHDGGIQHGEWSQKTRKIRTNGYYIATLLVDIDPRTFLARGDAADALKQMVLEQFLISADDGWIYRKAKYYRGAMQAEDEANSGWALLSVMLDEPDWREKRFFLLREAGRWLPHTLQTKPVSEIRTLSNTITEQDEGFTELRNKIHVRPDAGDAVLVRGYALSQANKELAEDYEHLASLIDAVYNASHHRQLQTFARRMRDPTLRDAIKAGLAQLEGEQEPERRLATSARLLAATRNAIGSNAEASLYALDASLLLEIEAFAAANLLRTQLDTASRRQRLTWLGHLNNALYGIGLLSARQRQAINLSLTDLSNQTVPLSTYRREIQYLAQATRWADQRLRFHFGDSVTHFREIEPMAVTYLDDRLRSSPLLVYAEIVDSLLRDANRLAGIQHNVFGEQRDSGLHPLNPGLARGTLRAADEGITDPEGIYILPEVTADLPRVGGILTADTGNAISHVQLLARNLGIPNVVIEEELVDSLQDRTGQTVVLAASPAGVVRIMEDTPQWDRLFSRPENRPSLLIRPDPTRLDLATRVLLPLDLIRQSDAGHRVGPKAAHLGELKHRYPDAVDNGLVIPFGVFSALLEKPVTPDGPSMRDWMRNEYKRLADIDDPQHKQQAVVVFLGRVRDWIHNMDPGNAFRDRLHSELLAMFGEHGSYGVFVRSDTNVEDLPGFTGAGLNLTVANVVGFDEILTAIQRVWASPFTERAYSWRQAHMDQPEHVYPSVLLMRSVPVEKSGVMITTDIDRNLPGYLSIAVNEGIGGAVAGQRAEELRINLETGRVRLVAEASEPTRKALSADGGLRRLPASGSQEILTTDEIATLIDLAQDLPRRFDNLQISDGATVPADVEFGFIDHRLVLFQVRPYLDDSRLRRNDYLTSLDQTVKKLDVQMVSLDQVP
jgi:hypothetical protein